MTIGIQDQRVIKAFCERRPQVGHKLSTDGQRLDGLWMGAPDLGQRAVRRCLATGSPKLQRRR